MSAAPIRIALADDQALVLSGLRALLRAHLVGLLRLFCGLGSRCRAQHSGAAREELRQAVSHPAHRARLASGDALAHAQALRGSGGLPGV